MDPAHDIHGDAAMIRAERAIAALQHEFAVVAERRIDRLAEIYRTRWAPAAARTDAVRDMRRIAHDLKGEAGTFGFALITDIADWLGYYLRETAPECQSAEAVILHLDALQQVWNDRLRDDGGAEGQRIRDRLTALRPYATSLR